MRNTKKAFLWMINILEENNIKYRISGGLAARAYGAKRKIADIDIEVLEKDIDNVYERVKDFVVYGPKIYKDENWDLMLMTLKYQGQEIDVAAVESKIFSKKIKAWMKKPGNLKDSNLKNIFGIKVYVEKLEFLVRYKKILSRDVDIEDLRQLQKMNLK